MRTFPGPPMASRPSMVASCILLPSRFMMKNICGQNKKTRRAYSVQPVNFYFCLDPCLLWTRKLVFGEQVKFKDAPPTPQHTHTHVRTYTHTHAAHTHRGARAHAYTYTHAYIHTLAYTHARAHLPHTHTVAHTHTHTYTHTHTHTHVPLGDSWQQRRTTQV